MISRGANVNMTGDGTFDTALELACQRSDDRMVKILLESGAGFERDATFAQKFKVALLRYSDPSVAEVLLAYKPSNIEVDLKDILSEGFNFPIYAVCRRGYVHLLDLFLAQAPDTGIPLDLLEEAVSNGHEAIVQRLLAPGKDINAVNYRGETALFWAANANDANMGMLKFLLDRKADVHAGQEQSGGPLFPAISRRKYEVVELLLQRGADFNKPRTAGDTAVKHALSVGCSAICRLLQQHGADIDDAISTSMMDRSDWCCRDCRLGTPYNPIFPVFVR